MASIDPWHKLAKLILKRASDQGMGKCKLSADIQFVSLDGTKRGEAVG